MVLIRRTPTMGRGVLLEAIFVSFISQLPSGALCSLFLERVPLETQQTKQDALSSHGHWASEMLMRLDNFRG